MAVDLETTFYKSRAQGAYRFDPWTAEIDAMTHTAHNLAALFGGIGSLMYGSCWPDMAMKDRTRICNSFGEKLNVGIRNVRYGRTPLRSRPGCGGNFAAMFAGARLVAGLAPGEADGCGLASALS